MNIQHAEFEEASVVVGILGRCDEAMRANGICQWDNVYPNLDVVETDARSGSLFVAREGDACVGAVALNDLQPEQYGSLPWRCTDGRVLVIHRLCVHPEWQQRGVGSRLMDFAEGFGRTHGFNSIRLDAYTGNPAAIALYVKRGYQRIGQTFFPRRPLPFDCFELVIV